MVKSIKVLFSGRSIGSTESMELLNSVRIVGTKSQWKKLCLQRASNLHVRRYGQRQWPLSHTDHVHQPASLVIYATYRTPHTVKLPSDCIQPIIVLKCAQPIIVLKCAQPIIVLKCAQPIIVLKCARICLALWVGALKPTRKHPHMANREYGLGFVAVNALRKKPHAAKVFCTGKIL